MRRSGARPRISMVASSQFPSHGLDDAVQTGAVGSQENAQKLLRSLRRNPHVCPLLPEEPQNGFSAFIPSNPDTSASD